MPPRGLQPATTAQAQRKKRSFFSKKSTLPPLPIVRTRSPPRSVPSATVLHSLEPDMRAVSAGKTFMRTEMGEDKWEVVDRTRVTRSAAAETDHKPVTKRRAGTSITRKAAIAKVNTKQPTVGSSSAPASVSQSAGADAALTIARIKLRTQHSPSSADTMNVESYGSGDSDTDEVMTPSAPPTIIHDGSPVTEPAHSAAGVASVPSSSRTRFWATATASTPKETLKKAPRVAARTEAAVVEPALGQSLPYKATPKQAEQGQPALNGSSKVATQKDMAPETSEPRKKRKAPSALETTSPGDNPSTRRGKRTASKLVNASEPASSHGPSRRTTRRSTIGSGTQNVAEVGADKGFSDVVLDGNGRSEEGAGPSTESQAGMTSNVNSTEADLFNWTPTWSAALSHSAAPSSVTPASQPETPSNPANPANKKKYMSAGIYCDEPIPPRDYQLVNRVLATRREPLKALKRGQGEDSQSSRYTFEDATFPPLPDGRALTDFFEKEHDFKLPYDIIWEGRSGVLDSRWQPPAYEHITSSESDMPQHFQTTTLTSDQFLERPKIPAPGKEICHCTPGTGCGLRCTNRLMGLLCGKGCSNGPNCGNEALCRRPAKSTIVAMVSHVVILSLSHAVVTPRVWSVRE